MTLEAFKAALRGNGEVPSQLGRQWADYQMVMLTGWTFEQIDAAPARRCYWLLKIDNAVKKEEERRRTEQAEADARKAR